MVYQIALDQRGRARWVRYFDGAGHGHEIEAEVVILACGAVESARLLLLSHGSDGGALANSSGLVGRNLTFHVFTEIGGFFDTPIHLHRGAPSTRAFDDLYFLPSRAEAPLGGVLLLGDGLGPVQFACDRTPWGHGHHDAMLRYPHHGRLFIVGQDLPRVVNDVTLDPAVRDCFGIPVARITHENHPIDQLAAHFSATRAQQLLEESGAKDVYQEIPENTSGDAHQHGTCRFGNDPKTSVLDRACASHDIPNLFVADGSFMPTSGGVNPALTIQANALRVADLIFARGKRGEL
jgi:choline dehydrogenase-like flavoprotein